MDDEIPATTRSHSPVSDRLSSSSVNDGFSAISSSSDSNSKGLKASLSCLSSVSLSIVNTILIDTHQSCHTCGAWLPLAVAHAQIASTK